MVPRPGVTNSGGLPSPHPTANASVGKGEKLRGLRTTRRTPDGCGARTSERLGTASAVECEVTRRRRHPADPQRSTVATPDAARKPRISTSSLASNTATSTTGSSCGATTRKVSDVRRPCATRKKSAASSPRSAAHTCQMSSMHIRDRSEEHTSELQSLTNLVCRLLLEKKKKKK